MQQSKQVKKKNIYYDRQSMPTLHRYLYKREYGEVWTALTSDASVAMRIDDSLEEDQWIDDWIESLKGRKSNDIEIVSGSHIENDDSCDVTASDSYKCVEGSSTVDLNNENSFKNSETSNNISTETNTNESIGGSSELPMRHWGGNQIDRNVPQSDHYGNVGTDNDDGLIPITYPSLFKPSDRRTLLHVLCRTSFHAEELLKEIELKYAILGKTDEWENSDEEELHTDWIEAKALMQGLISHSHNEQGFDTENATEKNENDCHYCQYYCPPMPLPPVERTFPEDDNQDDGSNLLPYPLWQPWIPSQYQQHQRQHQQHDTNDAHSLPPNQPTHPANDSILHTSVLTMTDYMGNTPLHALMEQDNCHSDFVRIFLKGCRPLPGNSKSNNVASAEGDALYCENGKESAQGGQTEVSSGCCVENGNDRKPTIHELLSAQNGHGCTPLHYIVDGKKHDALTMLLKECPASHPYYSQKTLHSDELHSLQTQEKLHPPLHPLLLPDNDGDLPLHFAALNGVEPVFLQTLTGTLNEEGEELGEELGDARSSLIRNSRGSLAIDDLIVWFIEEVLDEDRGMDILVVVRTGDEGGDGDGNSSDGSESDGSEDSEDSEDEENSDAMESEQDLEINATAEKDVSSATRSPCKEEVDPMSLVTNRFRSLLDHGETHVAGFGRLWDQMQVLIRAAAKAIVLSTASRGELALKVGNTDMHQAGESTSSKRQSLLPFESWSPVHDAVIATKYGNFPALALVASIRLDNTIRGNGDVEMDDGRDVNGTHAISLATADGYLPLHLACENRSFSLAPSRISDDRVEYRGCTSVHDESNKSSLADRYGSYPLEPRSSQYSELARWNTTDLPCSMINFLLKQYPLAARIPTKQGRLPLHLILDGNMYSMGREGCSWQDIKLLLRACPEALGTPDVVTHLYPFQAAAASSSDVNLFCNYEANLVSTLSSTTTSQNYDDEEEQSKSPIGSVATRLGIDSVKRKSRLHSLELTYRLIMEDPSLCRAHCL